MNNVFKSFVTVVREARGEKLKPEEAARIQREEIRIDISTDHIPKEEEDLYEEINTHYDELGLFDGSVYVGQFKDNQRDGHGIWTTCDGHRYEGQWKNGKPHGEGIQFHENGNLHYEGQWKNGKRIKWIGQAKESYVSGYGNQVNTEPFKKREISDGYLKKY